MNACVYIGIVIFAIGLFLWLFAASKLKGFQNSFVPVPANKICIFQVLTWVGVVCFLGGIALAIFSV